MRFEELVEDPDNSLTDVCKFLGLAYDNRMLDYDNNSSYGKPDASLINQWHRKMSEREIELVEYRAGELMRWNGYEQKFQTPKGPSQIESMQLKIQDVIYREKFNINRFGPLLHYGLRVARLFGLSTLKKNLLAKRRVIVQKHLK